MSVHLRTMILAFVGLVPMACGDRSSKVAAEQKQPESQHQPPVNDAENPTQKSATVSSREPAVEDDRPVIGVADSAADVDVGVPLHCEELPHQVVGWDVA